MPQCGSHVQGRVWAILLDSLRLGISFMLSIYHLNLINENHFPKKNINIMVEGYGRGSEEKDINLKFW